MKVKKALKKKMEARSDICLPAEKKSLNQLIQFIVCFAKNNGFDSRSLWELELVSDEIFSNIINYAYPRRKGSIQVHCSMGHNDALLMEIHDQGVPFNPLSIRVQNHLSDIQGARTNGYGIPLMRRLMDRIVYTREQGGNCLTLEKKARFHA